MKTLKLGTRRSLLAMAQSGWVARELERLHPGLRVELVGIETRGDQIQNIPLSQIEGKDFFVAELDSALTEGRVDLCVHSMKDLSLTRPEAITLGAVPRREAPQDVLLLGPGAQAALDEGRVLRIGTSSPRRLENLPGFLSRALPQTRPQFVQIRGNVNTRLSRVHEPPASERALEGVVLAWAGLIRLWADPQARVELGALLRGTRWIVVPLLENPSAPAQGALAVECRTQDAETRRLLAAMHDASTLEGVAREREVLAEYGGGCHQRFGATAWKHPLLGWLMAVRGSDPEGRALDELRWERPASGAHPTPVRAWDAVTGRERTARETRLPLGAEDRARLNAASAVFVAHYRAVDAEVAQLLKRSGARIWVSGMSTWKKLGEWGLHVEGSSEGMGSEALAHAIREPVLQLPAMRSWVVLTHRDAISGWATAGLVVIPTYSIEHRADAATGEALRGATHVFWGSGSQWDALKATVQPHCVHATGAGKTAQRLRSEGVQVQVFPNRQEWRKWILEQGGSFL